MVEFFAFVAAILIFAVAIEFLQKLIHHGAKYALGYLKRASIAVVVGLVLLAIFAATQFK